MSDESSTISIASAGQSKEQIGPKQFSNLPDFLEKQDRIIPLETIPKLCVLVVDDEYLVRNSICRVLKEWFVVYTAASAEQALLRLTTTDLFAIVTDYQMTGNDGIWLLNWVKQLQPEAKRMLASSVEPSDLEDCLDSGLIDHFFDTFDLFVCFGKLFALSLNSRFKF